MKTDVEVRITGLPFDQKAVNGVSISYNAYGIPTASIQLVAPYIEEQAKSFLCDPDSFKKQTRDNPVNISIKSKTGCINFDGVFDGMSFIQTPGGFSYAAILKSKFQPMLELYPKFIGLDSASTVPFRRQIVTTTKFNEEDPFDAFQVATQNVTADNKTLVEFYIELVKALVNSQINLIANSTADTLPILELMKDERYKKNTQKCLDIINQLDLTHVKKMKVRANKQGNGMLRALVDTRDTLWDIIDSCLDSLGCMMLVGNDTIFMVPKANYLKMSNLSTPGFQEQSTTPNVAYPSDVLSFSINDVSYRNLRGCYVVPAGAVGADNIRTSYLSSYIGSFPNLRSGASDIPDDGSSGLLIVEAPQFLIQNLDGLYTANERIQNSISSGAYAGEVVEDPNQPKQEYADVSKNYSSQIQAAREVLDMYAKSRFLQEKYSERGGTLTLNVLKPNWVPGTTGAVYTRHPGLFYSFFVTNVTHSVSLGEGNSGHATTQVSFNSCRYAGNPGKIPGTNSVELYDYSASDMATLQQSWLDDVSGKAKEDIQNYD